MVDTLNVFIGDTQFAHREDSTGDHFAKEVLSMAHSQGIAGGIPAFVVEAADQHRQLRSEVRLQCGDLLADRRLRYAELALEAGLPPGLTSVLIQLQGPLTLVLAALFLRERATPGQWLGLAVAMIGVKPLFGDRSVADGDKAAFERA